MQNFQATLVVVILSQTVMADDVIGYYSLSWLGGYPGATNSTSSVFFSGWNNVQNGLWAYKPESQPALRGFKYFCFGGGKDATGHLSTENLEAYINDIPSIASKGFQGVMFDVEILNNTASVMNPVFAKAFNATKTAGLKVGVTTSHSAPFSTMTPQDGVDFVKAWVKDTNIDLISPQLYKDGDETAPQFEPTSNCVEAGCTYDLYKNMHPGMQFAPSITYAYQYSDVKTYFKSNYGIDVAGYLIYYQAPSAEEASKNVIV